MLSLITAGESHGPELVAVLSGLPSGLRLSREAIDRELARRQHGFGRGGRQKIEKDQVEVRAGLRNGVTLGSPLVLAIRNRDFENWAKVMDPWETDPAQAARRQLTAPRPGHADLAGAWKFNHREDLRNVLERASARETAARVAAGAVCKQFLANFGVEVRSGVLALGEKVLHPGPPSFELLAQVDDHSPLRTPFPEKEAELVAYVEAVKHQGDTLGGIVGVVARGVPPGLGSYTQWDERLDGQLAQAIMAVQAVKAVVIGAGWEVALGPGSNAHDPIVPGEIDRGGAINTITPHGLTSKKCTGMVVSGFLVQVARVTDEEMAGWRRDYPEAFERAETYDPATGVPLSGWLEQ